MDKSIKNIYLEFSFIIQMSLIFLVSGSTPSDSVSMIMAIVSVIAAILLIVLLSYKEIILVEDIVDEKIIGILNKVMLPLLIFFFYVVIIKIFEII